MVFAHVLQPAFAAMVASGLVRRADDETAARASKSLGAPAVGLALRATSVPARNEATKFQVPVSSGAKFTRHWSPLWALVLAALPSAAQ